jgi:hypothetical protein
VKNECPACSGTGEITNEEMWVNSESDPNLCPLCLDKIIILKRKNK